MKKILFILVIMFSFFNKTSANYSQLAYEFEFKNIDGGLIKLSDYKNKVIVIVNVASRCGFTKQYDDLQLEYTRFIQHNSNAVAQWVANKNLWSN